MKVGEPKHRVPTGMPKRKPRNMCLVRPIPVDDARACNTGLPLSRPQKRPAKSSALPFGPAKAATTAHLTMTFISATSCLWRGEPNEVAREIIDGKFLRSLRYGEAPAVLGTFSISCVLPMTWGVNHWRIFPADDPRTSYAVSARSLGVSHTTTESARPFRMLRSRQTLHACLWTPSLSGK